MQKFKDIIKPKDIIDRVKEPKKPKISKAKRAEIILDRALKEKTYRQLKKDNKIDYVTGYNIVKDNKELVNQIQSDKSSIKISRDIKVIDYSFTLLLKKLERLINNSKQLDNTRVNELVDLITKLRNEVRLTKGEATTITATQQQNPEQLRTRILTLAEIVKGDDKTRLAELVFDNNNDNR